MRPLSFHSDELHSLLLRNNIATLDELKQALGTSVDVTVFRKLKPLDYLTSYSHRGRYYTIAHYPTGASKWNPIEHRLFSEISKHWAAEPLVSYEKMLGFIRNTRTKTGLVVTAYLDRAEYPTGLKPDRPLTSSLGLKPGKILPRWNYTIAPNL